MTDRTVWMDRAVVWLLSPGFTGFTRVAHLMWCLGGILQYMVLLPCIVWFGYCCWSHDISWVGAAGFAVLCCALMSNVSLVVAAKTMTTESIRAKQEGRDLEF